MQKLFTVRYRNGDRGYEDFNKVNEVLESGLSVIASLDWVHCDGGNENAKVIYCKIQKR